MTQNEFLRGQRINPKPVTGKETVADLVDNAFLAYNAGRLAEGCRLFAERMLDEDVTVGMSLTGAMTPAGLGMSTISQPQVSFVVVHDSLYYVVTVGNDVQAFKIIVNPRTGEVGVPS